jgi:hypothetical protein
VPGDQLGLFVEGLLSDHGPERPPHAEPLPRAQTIVSFAGTVTVTENRRRLFSAADDTLAGDEAARQLLAAGGFSLVWAQKRAAETRGTQEQQTETEKEKSFLHGACIYQWWREGAQMHSGPANLWLQTLLRDTGLSWHISAIPAGRKPSGVVPHMFADHDPSAHSCTGSRRWQSYSSISAVDVEANWLQSRGVRLWRRGTIVRCMMRLVLTLGWKRTKGKDGQ